MRPDIRRPIKTKNDFEARKQEVRQQQEEKKARDKELRRRNVEGEPDGAQPFIQKDDDTYRRKWANRDITGYDANDPIDEPINADVADIYRYVGPRMKTGYIRRVYKAPIGPLPDHDKKRGDLTQQDCLNFAMQYAETNASTALAARDFGIMERTAKAIIMAYIDNRRRIKAPGPPQKEGPGSGPPMTRDVTPAVMQSRPRGGIRRFLRATPKRPLPQRNGELPLDEAVAYDFAREYVSRPELSLRDLANEWKISGTCAMGIIRSLVDTSRDGIDPRDRPGLDMTDPDVQELVIEKYRTGAYTIRELADDLGIREFDVWRLVSPLGLVRSISAARGEILFEEVMIAALEAARQAHRVIDRATPYQAAIVSGVMIDKMRALAGEPDLRIRHEHTLPNEPTARRAALAGQLEQADKLLLRAGRKGSKLRVSEFKATKKSHSPPRSTPAKKKRSAAV